MSAGSSKQKSIAWAAQLTGLADRLVTTRKAKGIHRQLVADGASQLEWNFTLGQSAVCGEGLARTTLEDRGRRKTYLAMSMRPAGGSTAAMAGSSEIRSMGASQRKLVKVEQV